MNNDPIISIKPLSFPWETTDPFLFCVYHVDAYPAGNEQMGPSASLAGRRLGQDFEGKDGWRMYHGDVVPGFPHHPHRGFETVTIVRSGLIDHADSLGAAARYGRGDVQWLTAGSGINHSEMFPLIDNEHPNPLELFQIWLNLPKASKFAEPHFTMFWSNDVPHQTEQDDAGNTTEVTIIAGRLGQQQPLPPPPESWASRPDSDVAIWTIKMAAHAQWTLPAAAPETNRTLYVFRGSGLEIGDRSIQSNHSIALHPELEVVLKNGPDESELLLLQGRPIGEPVVQYGPFVMNSEAEIQQAFADYRQTQFGGWPWPGDAPVHPRDEGRFARHADGRVEKAS